MHITSQKLMHVYCTGTSLTLYCKAHIGNLCRGLLTSLLQNLVSDLSLYPFDHIFIHPSTYLHTYPPTQPPIHPFICLSIHPSTHLSIYPSVYPSIIYLHIYLLISLTIHQSIYPSTSIHLFIFPSIYSSIHLCSNLPIHLTIYLSVYPSICMHARPPSLNLSHPKAAQKSLYSTGRSVTLGGRGKTTQSPASSHLHPLSPYQDLQYHSRYQEYDREESDYTVIIEYIS
jgi:hypothetical protein